jgi:hypothetical protein
MDRDENDLSELDLDALTFDLSDEVLERAAADGLSQSLGRKITIAIAIVKLRR